MTTTYPYLLPEAPAPVLAPPRRRGLRRAVLGPSGQPTWVRPSVLALLAATALLYLWDLGASGNANDFYAAAVQAGTKSWKAMFFGSLDSGNFITVDKPPASLWPMELAGRIFGFSSWSMLVPQALMGVAAVALLYLTVKRWFGPIAGLIAGALLAVTPVAVLMFRFNNPDALMTLLLVLAAYGVTRAIDDGKLRWLLVAGAAMGFDFLTKSLQPFTVLPALAVVYLVAANTTLGRRIRNLLLAGAAMVVSAGWWVLAVTLTPASSRPYIGGSGDNSVWGLAWGYNGLSRLSGGVGGGAPSGSRAAAPARSASCPESAELASLVAAPAGVPEEVAGADSAARPGSAGCSTPSSAPRSLGSFRPRCSRASPCSSSPAAHLEPTGPEPRPCCGAAGSSSPPECSATPVASSTPTTRCNSLPPLPPSSRLVRWCYGGIARSSVPG